MKRSENGSRFEGYPLEKDASGTRAPSDLAGLRNQVRMICRVAAIGDLRETRLQLDALLDDLRARDVAFSWNGGALEQVGMDSRAAERTEEAKKEQRRGVAAYCAENPAMTD